MFDGTVNPLIGVAIVPGDSIRIAGVIADVVKFRNVAPLVIKKHRLVVVEGALISIVMI